MLLWRSISSLHICLLLVSLSTVHSQYYSSDYTDGDSDHNVDHASYHSKPDESTAEDDRPDYSKYYKNEGASSSLLNGAPLLAGAPSGAFTDGDKQEGGFVSPLDFSGFFDHAQFGAESNQKQTSLPLIPVQNPFHFQEALKKQNSTGFVDASEFSANFANAPSFELEVGKHFSNNPFEQKADTTFESPKAAYKHPKPQSYKEADDLNSYKDTGKNYEKNSGYNKPKDYSAPLTTSFNYAPIPTLSSYTSGKLNLAPVKSYGPQLFPAAKLTNAPLNVQSTLTPYNFDLPNLDLKSTLAPLNSYNVPSTSSSYYPGSISPTEFAQPSEYNAQKAQNCQKVDKHVSKEDISHGRFRRQADKMNCFLCKDPKSGGTYEQCSYTSSPQDDNSYFRGHAEKYSTKSFQDPDEHARKRREAEEKRNKRQKDEHYVNPYNYEKTTSHNFNSKPKEFDGDYYKSPDFSHYEKDSESNYGLGPEYYSDASTADKSYSELQSEELKKNKDNCKQVKKDSLTCMVCSNPKTGGNYEQCSYSTEPNEKKYSYVKEKKYNSNDPDPEEKTVESTEIKPSKFAEKPNTEFSASTKHATKIKDDDYYIPHDYFSESKNNEKYFKDLGDQNKNSDFLYKIFPEYAEKESKNREVKQPPNFEYKSGLPEYFTAEESKKDVDSVLEEFSQKDRSKCKKIVKDKMTCYICTDAKGVQHEECMFVSASEPKSSHIAYHEVKEFSSDPKNGEATADSKPKEVVLEVKRKTKKVTPITLKEVDAEPTEYVKVAGKKARIVRRRTNIPADYIAQESKQSEVKVEGPKEESKEEFEGPDGAYASELVPVFSEKLGMTLPKYMLEITEGEKVFDDVVKSG